uniref:Uncharacterized protein n=1 Tax=viral metagenome TaxID=1070528 RepID=A0A6C0LL88_9ZZZZ
MSFNNKLSLYIPRIANNCFANSNPSFNNISDFVGHIFHSLDIGRVNRVDLVPIYTKNGGLSNFSKGFVHFDAWYYTSTATSIQTKMLDVDGGEMTKIVYDDPNYWIIKHNTSVGKNERSEITDLKEQVADMTTRLETYHIMLSSAQHQLGNLEGLIANDHTNGIEAYPGPVKRRRQGTYNHSTTN